MSVEVLWDLKTDGPLHETQVDEASTRIMLQIEQQMSRLEVMGGDNRRSLWIDLQAPDDPEECEDHLDRDGVAWYEVTTSQYGNVHFLRICDNEWRLYMLRTNSVSMDQRPTDVTKPLKQLEAYLTKIIDSIVEDSDRYNRYIAEHLPYSKRSGLIRRSVLNSILPSERPVANPKEMAKLVREMNSHEPLLLEKMALRQYIHYWYIGYSCIARRDAKTAADVPFSLMLDIFERVSGWRNEEGYDLDSEEDYQSWYREYQCYHALDIVYARIHFSPYRSDSSKWYFTLSFGSYGFLDQVLKIAKGYYDAGVYIRVEPEEDILGILEETDQVSIVSAPSHYMPGDGVGNQISLPWVGDEVTEEQLDAIIKATVWEPIDAVRPL